MFEFLLWLCVLLLPLLARFIIGLAMLWVIVVTVGPARDMPLMPGYGLLGLAVAAALSVMVLLALPYFKASLSSTRWRHAFWALSLAAIGVVMALICNVGDANSPPGIVAILCICLAFGERALQFNSNSVTRPSQSIALATELQHVTPTQLAHRESSTLLRVRIRDLWRLAGGRIGPMRPGVK